MTATSHNMLISNKISYITHILRQIPTWSSIDRYPRGAQYGSEMTEDQQLLDSGNVEPAAQLGYGTFYDHATGYYYEYPVMLVGPPMPEQVEPNCLAAVSCGPVPLRPIEWVNPAFVPKLSGQQYCYTDYQTTQNMDCAQMVDAEGTIVTGDNSTMNGNGDGNESCAGSASCSGSVAGEEDTLEQTEEVATEELSDNQVQDGFNGPYLEPTLVQPMHIPHVMQPLAPQYMYPGHYMFGPSLVNVNGVTIQSGPVVRYSDVMATTTSATCAKWKRKKRKRKQKRPPTLENTEDEEEEYSSECENGTTRPPWSANSSTTTTSRPLNPECQEFQLRSIAELESTKSAGQTSHENLAVETKSPLNEAPSISPTLENAILPLIRDQPLVSVDKEKLDSTTVLNDCPKNGDESKRLTESRSGFQKEPSAHETGGGGRTEPRRVSDIQEPTLHPSKSQDSANLDTSFHSSPHHPCTGPNLYNSSNGDLKRDELERLSKETLITLKPRINGVKEPEEDLSKLSNSLSSLEISFSSHHGDAKPCSRPASPEINRTTTPINAETQRLPESYESLVTRPVIPPRRKYSSKSAKFVREPTPGPDLTSAAIPEVETVKVVEKEPPRHNGSLDSCENESKICERLAEVSNDSGFESQMQTKLDDEIEDLGKLDEGIMKLDRVKLEGRPITEAVTEWLRKANSPDLFITSNRDSETESDEEEEEEDENVKGKPPKNLQGNPMPALSANGSNNELLLLCGEFARTNQREEPRTSSSGSRSKRNSKNKKQMRKRNKSSKFEDKILKKQMQTEKIDCCSGTVRISNFQESSLVVGDCEFTEDRVAGMRVALSSRMNDEVKILRVQGQEEKDKDPAIVRTFEKGEIVVSIEGKLLPKSKYVPVLHGGEIIEKEQTERVEKDRRSGNQDKGEAGVEEIEKGASLGSIEEPDVLECWEAETLEPVASVRRLLSSRGSFHEGEAAEEDLEEVEQVKRYYKLVRESVTSCTSVEEEESDEQEVVVNSGTVPNSPESLQSEKMPPMFVSAERQRIPIDEAFEVYESCYNGSQFISLDPKFRKQRSYNLEDGPIPCKAVCCNIQ
ncbi:uncharacterized protein LOC117174509 [Belonocnema kinseyi]|uniref:uncharacterized protein LOC117174509 n=1 Tax=Belonocnema kinseyi TaxID=2817044 RepID=UPI00143E0066|nr:uncharacterized protein LOC117174509 [Belonocnema kinseyi]